MTKPGFIELASGKGDAEVYFCIPGNGANIGKFWDFVGLAWVTPITSNCKVFATEKNSDGTVSIYRADITVPAGGPYLVYCYLESTGKLQGQDITTEDEILDNLGTPLQATSVVEGSITITQALRLLLSVLVGKSTGGGTATIKFRDMADSKDRITATVDSSGNRTAITKDAD